MKTIDFEFVLAEGLIAADELGIFHTVDSAQEAWDHIRQLYSIEID